jgi:hypothetical protein
VLRGDMSLVGPRPHAPGTCAGNTPFELITDRYVLRHSVRPGMTGLAQVRGWRGQTDTEDKLLRRLDCDLDYIAHWSLWLDCKILALTVAALEEGIAVMGMGLGAQILALAAGGGVRSAPLAFEVSVARREVDGALFGCLPQEYPLVRYGPDRLLLPPRALTLARDPGGEPALFQLGERAFGFAGHPGIKSAIIEDLIMEFPDSPAETAAPLATLRARQADVRACLAALMVGLTRALGLMSTGS